MHDTHNIKVLKQDGSGKGDAVRKAFANASGDMLMILDADLTMPPEALPKFYAAIVSGKAEFVNGTRLVYPMEHEAMRPLNFDRQPVLRARVQLSRQPALQRHSVRHQGADRDDIMRRSRAAATISASSIRSAISI